MIDAGRVLKVRRDEQHLGAARHQGAIELGKAQVVADREADAPELGAGRDDLLAGRERVRLPEGRQAGELDVEQVDLAVAGDLLAGSVEQQARVVHIGAVGLEEASGQDPHVVAPRRVGETLGRRPRHRLGDLGVAT